MQQIDTQGGAKETPGMNAFTAIEPERRGSFGPSFDVNLYQAEDGDRWIAEADALPIATEASSLDALIDRVWEIAPEIAALNGHTGPLNLRFLLLTAAAIGH